ncbi:MAG: fumarylacetoacetate hydrolase family protein [Roseiflexaceae bacterium]
MRLYRFEAEGRQHLGAQHEHGLVDLAAAHAARTAASRSSAAPGFALPTDLLAFIQAGAAALDAAAEAITFAAEPAAPASARLIYSFDEVRLLAPITNPGKILCSGVNYLGHKQENPAAVLPENPGFFVKLSSAIIGPGEPIVLPKMSQQVDYEVEFAVVIGRRLHKAGEAEAMAGVFGYTILHDVSARDIQMKAPQPNQITLGKNFDTFSPIGPCVVTADELPTPGQAGLRTLLNGRLMQDGSTADWLFPLPFLLAYTSQIMTLEPGDIVTTGTPAGVGYFQKPQVFLKAGDVVVLEIDGIGRLENPVVVEE